MHRQREPRYCNIAACGRDLLEFTVGRSPYKQGRFLPGTAFRSQAGPDRLREARPDYVVILPWNLKDEIMEQLADVRSWGGRFVGYP